MPPEFENPLSLDSAISAKLSRLPSGSKAEGEYVAELAPGKEYELQPQAWELVDEMAVSANVTALDRPLEEVPPAFAFGALSDLTSTACHELQTRIGPIRFDGSALLGCCPDCGAPMTVRLWLGLADCWRCPASVVIDERIVAQIKDEVEKVRKRELPKPPPTPEEFFSRGPLETVAPRLNTGAASRIPDFDSDISDELDRLTKSSGLARALRRLFRITPAWLVSFMLHLIAILILAVIVFGDASPDFDEAITLSTFLDSSDREGGDIRMENPIDTLQDDVALATKMERGEKDIRDAVVQAAKDALELRVDPQTQMRLPELNTVRKNITSRAGYVMSFAARDPRVRAEIVKKEGGTNLTEASVARGLRWLASVQNDDGSWSLKNYSNSDRARNKGDAMGTALALLPFLGAGQTHEFGVYSETVASGLRWLLENQKDSGDLRGNITSQAGMYAHGQATIVLCEALALTGDRQFFDPVQRAVSFIEEAQHRQGGWRYRPKQAGDTSVFGWQMMALQSARAAGMDVKFSQKTLVRADQFLDSVSSQPRKGDKLIVGATYGYQPRREATEVMTAEAILCRMYLGWRKDDPRLKAGVDWLIEEHLPSRKDRNLYYWYYGTQVMHHFGDKPWEKWNKRVRTLLIESQNGRGRFPGSWSPDDFEWGNKGGRIYTTSMAVCTLEVYYRHLPLFKQLELE
jgi:hypothetical protein